MTDLTTAVPPVAASTPLEYALPNGACDGYVHITAALAAANPERCVWGSGWPRVILADAKMPDAGIPLSALLDVAT